MRIPTYPVLTALAILAAAAGMLLAKHSVFHDPDPAAAATPRTGNCMAVAYHPDGASRLRYEIHWLAGDASPEGWFDATTLVSKALAKDCHIHDSASDAAFRELTSD